MIYLIAHRGNVNGPNPERENEPSYLDEALHDGYDCEVDVWIKDKQWFLGHDKPQYKIREHYLVNNRYKFWCHAKSQETLHRMLELHLNCFWHENDKMVLTSKGFVWCFPSNVGLQRAINVMPELNNLTKSDLEGCVGVCSDYVSRYKEWFS